MYCKLRKIYLIVEIACLFIKNLYPSGNGKDSALSDVRWRESCLYIPFLLRISELHCLYCSSVVSFINQNLFDVKGRFKFQLKYIKN